MPSPDLNSEISEFLEASDGSAGHYLRSALLDDEVSTSEPAPVEFDEEAWGDAWSGIYDHINGTSIPGEMGLIADFAVSVLTSIGHDGASRLFLALDDGDDKTATSLLERAASFDRAQSTINDWGCFNEGRLVVADDGELRIDIIQWQDDPKTGKEIEIPPPPSPDDNTVTPGSASATAKRIGTVALIVAFALFPKFMVAHAVGDEEGASINRLEVALAATQKQLEILAELAPRSEKAKFFGIREDAVRIATGISCLRGVLRRDLSRKAAVHSPRPRAPRTQPRSRERMASASVGRRGPPPEEEPEPEPADDQGVIPPPATIANRYLPRGTAL